MLLSKKGFLCTSSCYPGYAQCKNKEGEPSVESDQCPGIAVCALQTDAKERIEIEEPTKRDSYKFFLAKLAWPSKYTKMCSRKNGKCIVNGNVIWIFELANFS